ncbi:MAG: sigma-70 family RNA polymerase sigma factor [Candidatus Protistobacter heckmanni]|nr:sigma-70 family RNA polymerase sigma factor [Candidatus Protistobacter heckmanni]
MRDARHAQAEVSFDEELHTDAAEDGHDWSDPLAVLGGKDLKKTVDQALEALPQAYREVLVLKEMEDCSYKEIADIVGVPIGTVMSRLARARKMLGGRLRETVDGTPHG